MSITIQSVIERVRGMLEDEGNVTYTLPDLVRYLVDGQTDMLTRRPDLFAQLIEHPLVTGWRQRIPSTCSALIAIHANVAGARRACTPVSAALLTAQVPGWRSMTPSVDIEHFMFDERDSKSFDVFPPAALGAKLAMECAVRPPAIPIPSVDDPLESIAGDIGVPDEQHIALQHYVCFRCFREGNEEGHAIAAREHLSLYADALGVEIQATLLVAPKTSKP